MQVPFSLSEMRSGWCKLDGVLENKGVDEK